MSQKQSPRTHSAHLDTEPTLKAIFSDPIDEEDFERLPDPSSRYDLWDSRGALRQAYDAYDGFGWAGAA